MKQAHAEVREHPVKPPVLGDRRGGLHPIGVLHQRADHECLVALLHLLPDGLVRRLQILVHGGNGPGPDPLATGRHLVQRGDVEGTVQGHRQGPGNGGGGHDQQIGIRSLRLLLELHPLVNPEPMLLVHHRRAQPGEPHPLLDQGVGTYHDVDAPARNVREQAGTARPIP